MDIEHNTGQHTWDNYLPPSDGKPKPDSVLSREAHGLKIEVVVVCRRVETVTIWVGQLLEKRLRRWRVFEGEEKDFLASWSGRLVEEKREEETAAAAAAALAQWSANLKMQISMTRLDAELIEKRVQNQIGAIWKFDAIPH